MDIKYLTNRMSEGMTLKATAELYGIPYGTIRVWRVGKQTPPDFVVLLLNHARNNRPERLAELQKAGNRKTTQERLQAARGALSMTNAAKAIGTHRRTWEAWELGENDILPYVLPLIEMYMQDIQNK